MQLYELGFAKIVLLRDDLAEVFINDGVVMSPEMVDEYHNFLVSHLHSPFSLLINKINNYTYDFSAQLNLATIKQINAMAVVVYSEVSELSTGALAAVPREVEWNIRMFRDRESALWWLLSVQEPPAQ